MSKLKEKLFRSAVVAIASATVASVAMTGCLPRGLRGSEVSRPKPGPLVPIPNASGATVHHWFSDGTLLLSEENKLLIYDPTSKTSTVAVTFDKGSTLASMQCVTDEVAIALYSLPTETQTSYRINWRSPQDYETIDSTAPSSFGNNYNLLDCERRRHRYDSALIKNEDGLVKHYGKTVSGIDGSPPIWAVDVFNSEFPPVSSGSPPDTDDTPDRRLELQTYSSAGQEFNADYDRTKDQYLWYKNANSFSAKPENWHLSTWLVSSDVKTAVEKPLPAGPWVYEHGFWKTMSCFSCGCACYERSRVQIENGQIYIRVFGQAVNEEHQGIYKLFEAEGLVEWIPVAIGKEIGNFVVSPDGCKIAINKEGPHTVEICN